MGSRLENNSKDVRKRIESHAFHDEEGEEYEGSKFGGFADYMRRKKIKLQNLDAEIRSQSSDRPQIFKNIVIHINGYTQPSLNDLHQLVVSHGGGFLQYLDGKTACTHVVASHLTPKKKVEFARYRTVKPAWIVDSVNAGKLLSWAAYRVVDEGVTQKVLGFENGNIVSQASTQRQGYRDQTESSWYTSHVRQFTDNESVSSNRQLVSPDTKSPAGKSRFGFDERGIPTLLDGSTDKIDERSLDHKAASPSPASPILASHVDVEGLDSDLESLEDAGGEGELIKIGLNEEGASKETKNAQDPHGEANMTADVRTGEKRTLTAEEHNAVLLSNPHMAKSSTANPDFINQYYRESRLHHLSTWKADLKAQLQARAQEKSSSQKARQKRAPGSRRYIMHVDFDSFFAAVSLRKNPHLANKPVVIAHGSGPGSEIASCNYPARKYGVKNGMWMKTASALCPDLKVLPYDFKLYEEASRQFYDSILAVDGLVQSISIDEALIDVSDQCVKAGGSDGRAVSEGSIFREQEKVQQIAQDLRTTIKDKTGCDVSVGMGNNTLLAKVALRKAKPAGQHLITPEDMLDFLAGLLVTDLPGVAWSIGKKLEEIGVTYVKDIRDLSKARLMSHLGPKTGEKIWDYSRGIDRQEVGEQVIRKSVSAEINWGIRFINQQQAEEFVQCLCDELSRRLNEQLVKGRQLTMKIMRKAADAGMDPPKNLGHGKCDTFNKSIVLGVATTDKAVIGKEAVSILRSYGFPPGELRGLGVQMQKLEPLKGAPTVTGTAPIDGSQRRLQFKKPTTTPASEQTRAHRSATASPAVDGNRTRLSDTADPIEEVPTPKKDRSFHIIEGVIQRKGPGMSADTGQRPLNVTGTQFVLPTQIDAAVLGELPADIRSKLAPKRRTIMDSIARPDSPHSAVKLRSASPQISDGGLGLPNQSQLDPDTLAELPEDVRQELLAHYHASSKIGNGNHLQQVLPQSPRKSKANPLSKKLVVTPTKKQKFTSLAVKGRARTLQNASSSLTQSNFVSMPKASVVAADLPAVDDEISQSFLEELPEDIRLEILAEQKRNRMKAKSGLNVGNSRRRPKAGNDTDALRGQQTLILPPQPSKPTFTSRKLSTLPELRDAMDAWVGEFSEGDEGPYAEDVKALGQYLERVILDEGDMAKAVAVLDWLDHILDMQSSLNKNLRAAWSEALSNLKSQVQDAVRRKGVPPLKFG